MTFTSAVSELRALLAEPAVPPEALASAARLVDHLDRCLVVIPASPASGDSSDHSVRLEPSDLFSRYLDAARSGKWRLLLALEADASSLDR